MALITALSLTDAQQLLAKYGIELARLTPLAAGSVNSNFLVDARNGRGYFGRIYEEQGPEGAEFELQLNETLAAVGIPVAEPLRLLDGGLHASFTGKPFALYQRVAGEVLCQASVTPTAARAVGQVLAKVHQADLGDLVVSEGRFGFDAIEQRLQAVEASQRADLMPAVERVRSLAKELLAQRNPALPKGLNHGDLFRDNVLVTGSGETVKISALLDFESACHGPYVYDLMVTLLAWCFGDGFDAKLVRAMVEGYHSTRALSTEERAAMVTEGGIACARFATTRLTDFSLRVPKGEKPLRDYQRFFKRFEALQSGALSQALTGLF